MSIYVAIQQLTRKKNHEAVITYEYYQTEKVKWYAEIEQWEGLKSIVLVKKTIEKGTVNLNSNRFSGILNLVSTLESTFWYIMQAYCYC